MPDAPSVTDEAKPSSNGVVPGVNPWKQEVAPPVDLGAKTTFEDAFPDAEVVFGEGGMTRKVVKDLYRNSLNISDVDLRIGQYENCTFVNCDFQGADLSSTRWTNCSFFSCLFAECVLDKTTFISCTFKGCDSLMDRLMGWYPGIGVLETTVDLESPLVAVAKDTGSLQFRTSPANVKRVVKMLQQGAPPEAVVAVTSISEGVVHSISEALDAGKIRL